MLWMQWVWSLDNRLWSNMTKASKVNSMISSNNKLIGTWAVEINEIQSYTLLDTENEVKLIKEDVYLEIVRLHKSGTSLSRTKRIFTDFGNTVIAPIGKLDISEQSCKEMTFVCHITQYDGCKNCLKRRIFLKM